MKSIDRTAYLARTAEGLTHNNRLVVPEFGVVALRLFKGAASSQSHRLPRSKTPRDPAVVGDDNFHFAPGPQLDPGPWTVQAAREDKVKLRYDFYNPVAAVKKARIEIFVRGDKSPVWHRELKDAELYDGERDLLWKVEDAAGTLQDSADWDGSLRTVAGKLLKSKRFPDGFLTTEHSPYKFKITTEGDAMCRSPTAWTYVHVLIDKLELEYGTVDMIPTKRDHRRALFQEILDAGTAPTANTKVFLTSNQFKAKTDEMFDNRLFNAHAERWGRGPKLPICARVYVRSSGDLSVLAPKALGHTKFMWDWESRSAATGNTFVDQALNYDIGKVGPKGRNCHKERGGKRLASDEVFPAQPGHDPPTAQAGKFPFKVVSSGKPRAWAAYSEAWREGVFACKTGVIFQPARMAGDKYKLTLYAAHEQNADGKLRLHVDTDAPLPIQAALKVESGEFEIWRRIDIVKYIQKSLFGGMSLATVRGFYQRAFVEINDKTAGVVSVYPAGDWNTRAGAIIASWRDFDRYFVDPAVDQHAGGSQGLILRSRTSAKTYLRATFPASFPNDAALEAWLAAEGMATANDYAAYFKDVSTAAMLSLFDHVVHADDGLNIFHVSRANNLITNQMGTLVGLAHDFNGAKQAANRSKEGTTRCAFLMLADAAYYALRAPDTVEQVSAHECGHHFMLPHPRNTAENKGANANRDYKAHDMAVSDCLMSYRAGLNNLCGFCQLRLRGWNKNKLKVDGTLNEKT